MSLPKDERETPPELFARLNAWGHFDLDAFASHRNALCDRYCTVDGEFSKVGGWQSDRNGLVASWAGRRVFGNPPFSMLEECIEQAHREAPGARRIVYIIPANRCEQPFWQKMIEPFRDGRGPYLSTYFEPGRTRFLVDGKPIMAPPKVSAKTGKPLKQQKGSAEFGIVVLRWELYTNRKDK